jgi:hypothetical protein
MIKKTLTTINILIITLLSSSLSYAQLQNYQYKRALQGVTETWHSIELPNDIYGKISKQYADIRIIGITQTGDTIKVPYLFKTDMPKNERTLMPFKRINTAHQSGRYYMTFEMDNLETINRIDIDFLADNFDMRIKLEGSNQQKEWFTLLDDYRILSIKNTQTDYRFTQLIFENAKYKYFRISAANKALIDTRKVGIYQVKATDILAKSYQSNFRLDNKNKSRSDVFLIDLPHPVPVSQIEIKVNNNNDYYRPVRIEILEDSVKTDKAWHYNYRHVFSGTLTSFEKNIFSFDEVLTNKMMLTINNQDNESLDVRAIIPKAYKHWLLARFPDKPAEYYLLYGNKDARKPQYDLVHFQQKMPQKAVQLSLQDEQIIAQSKTKQASPLFMDERLLWAIMLVIIAVLGWFSLKMLQKPEKK